MNYLSGLLKGEAARAISGLPLTNNNYSTAVTLLRDRFGQNQVLINAYMDALIKTQSPTCDVKKLRNFYDLCESYIRGLEALDVKSESYGNLLVPIVMKKSPEEMRRLLLRSHEHAGSSLDDLRVALRREIETRERSRMPSSSSDSTPTPDTVPPFDKISIAEALMSGTSKSSHNNSTCIYCDGQHKPEKCNAVSTAERRINILRRQRRCFNCLKMYHFTRTCHAKMRCSICCGKHHVSICKPQSGDTIKETRESNVDQTTHVGAAHSTQSRTSILLPSATVIVQGRSGSRQARVLFDTGSQRTFVTKKLATELNLPSKKRELLNVSTFGTNRSYKAKFDVVSLILTKGANKVEVLALVSSVISPPISVGLNCNWQNYPELTLADDLIGQSRLDIDIIVGSDNYDLFITGEVIRCKDGPMATKSKFGWLLSGPVHLPGRQNSAEMLCQRIEVCREDNDILPTFWEINTYEKCAAEGHQQENEVLQSFKESVVFNSQTGRYQVRLPWKDNTMSLPSNLGICKKRLRSLLNRLDKIGPDCIKKYDETIQDQLKRGFIEKVDNTSHFQGNLHYIPHLPVFKEDSSTTKMRIVYDASARTSNDSSSLNDCLHTGPCLLKTVGDSTAISTSQVCLYSRHRKGVLTDGTKQRRQRCNEVSMVKQPCRVSG